MQTSATNGANGTTVNADRLAAAMISAGVDAPLAYRATNSIRDRDADAVPTTTPAETAVGGFAGATWDDLSRAAPFVCVQEGPTGRPQFVMDFPAGHRALGISDGGMRLATRLIDDTNALIERGAYAVDRFGNLSFTEHGFRIFGAYYLGERIAGKLYAHQDSQEIAGFQLSSGITIDPGFFSTKITLNRATAQRLIDGLASGAAATIEIPLLSIGLALAALVTLIANSVGRKGVCIYLNTFAPGIAPMVVPRQ